MRTPAPDVLAFLEQVAAADGRRQAAVDVEGQRPLLHDILAVLAGFLEHAADPRLEQVPVDEQLSAGLRTAQPVAAERDFVAAVVRGAAARADVLAAREDAAH